MTDKNEDIDWETLTRRINSGKVIPILGDKVGHDGFLTSDKLIQKWAKDIRYPWTKTTNITRVAQYYDEVNPLTILAGLNIPLYITTSYHPFITRALNNANKREHIIEVCPWYPGASEKSSELDSED